MCITYMIVGVKSLLTGCICMIIKAFAIVDFIWLMKV